MKPITTREYMILLVACVLTVLIVMKQCKGKGNVIQSNVLYEHINDSTKYYKDKYNNEVASTYLLQGTNTALLLNLKTNNETIKWLQQEVRDNKDKVKDGGTIGVIGANTSFTSTSTTTVIPNNSPVNICNPTYVAESKDTTWYKYYITSNKDSTKLNLKVKNKYTVVFGQEKVKGKLFKKQPVALVTNKNPYTHVTEMKVYEVVNKTPKRVSISVGAGYCIPLFTFKPQPYIGVGVHYNIINLW